MVVAQDALVLLLNAEVWQVEGLKLLQDRERTLRADDVLKPLVHEGRDGRLQRSCTNDLHNSPTFTWLFDSTFAGN